MLVLDFVGPPGGVGTRNSDACLKPDETDGDRILWIKQAQNRQETWISEDADVRSGTSCEQRAMTT